MTFQSALPGIARLQQKREPSLSAISFHTGKVIVYSDFYFLLQQVEFESGYFLYVS